MAETKQTTVAVPEPEEGKKNTAPVPPIAPINVPVPPTAPAMPTIKVPAIDTLGMDALRRVAENFTTIKLPEITSITLPNIGADFSKSAKLALDLINNTPSLTKTLSNVNPSIIETESTPQSRQFEELNRKVSDTLAQVEKLQGDLSAAKKEAAEQVAAATKLIDDARKELAGAQKTMTNDLGRVRKRVGITDNEVSRSQLKLVETLGLFVAAFGFIALSANALKDVQNGNELSGALLIVAGLIMSFVLALDLVVRRWRYDIEGLEIGWKDTILKWLVPQGVLLLFVIGVLFWGANLLSQGNREVKEQNKPIPTPTVSQPPAPTPTVIPKPTPTNEP